MNTGSDPATNLSDQAIEQIRRQINRLFEEVAQLVEQDLAPPDFYREFLQRVLMGVAAPAGAVWMRTQHGNLQLQFQTNMAQTGLDNESAKQSHDELLRQVCAQARPLILPPKSGSGPANGNGAAAGNPTSYFVLLAPIMVEKQVAGLVEIWQDPRHSQEALPGFLTYVARMAGLASVFARNQQLRQMVGQQQVWTQLEVFARQIHGSLNPTEVAYLIANEGRRLVECDRLSVAVRHGKNHKVEAISGADVVEKRSNLVQLLRKLTQEVAEWGERLVYQGTKDDTLPPKVLQALDSFLAESNSKLLVVLPLRDEREKEKKKSARSVLVMESFDPPSSTDQLIARLEVVSRHATSALYNAIEHRRIPLRWIWQPLAAIEEGLGGKARTITYIVSAVVLAILMTLIFVPYPLKMDTKGQLLPEDRRWIYSPVESARVVQFPDYVFPTASLARNADVVLMYDQKLETKVNDLRSETRQYEAEIASLSDLYNRAPPGDQPRINGEKQEKAILLDRKKSELESLRDRTHFVEAKPGYFWLKAPIQGTVLSWDFRENLTNRSVKPSEPMIRIGDKSTGWEIELKIPQRHIGQILKAFNGLKPGAELDVDVLLMSAPTETFRGKLSRDKIAAEANPQREDNNESEPAVLASVRIDGPDIPESLNLVLRKDNLLVAGTEVHAKVRCGNHAMGYSLFYGVWEFIYEKVVFFF